jgi:DNA polymerase-3 subunit gamma/tau
VLDQAIAALRECLLASVGCDAGMLTLSQGLGVDLAALGTSLGTATLLAMLQILDQSLARMRTSGHASLLAEMAVIRLATLEDLESMASAIDRVGAAGPGAAAGGASPAAPRPAVARSVAVAAPAPQKKTTDLTPAVAERPPAAVQAAQPAPAPERVAVDREAPTMALPSDAFAAWQAASATLEGLAGDCAAEATAAAWRDDQLEVTLPATATTAATFLRRPEVVASIARALEGLAGRRVRHAIVMADPPADGGAAAVTDQPRAAAVPSQTALLREAADHPLVAHARTLFDAAIRKVEPPRPRERPATPAVTATVAAGVDAAVADDAGEAGPDEEEHDG